MGVIVTLENFDGEIIDKLDENFRPHSFSILQSQKFKVLKYIDQYDDTTFNSLMCKDFISDLEELRKDESSNKQQIDKLLALALKCTDEPHTYLKFDGD